MIRHRTIGLILALTALNLEAQDNFTPKKLTLLKCFQLQKNMHTGHVPTVTKKVSDSMSLKHQELKGLNYDGVISWEPKKRKAVERFMVEKFDMDFLAQKLPTFDKSQKLGIATVKVNEIRWSQVSCRNMSQDGKYSVVSNAHAIKDGTLKVEKLPTIRVWRDTEGRIWTLDHRRLAAIKLSGVIDEIKVEFVDEALVAAQKFKFGTQNEGKSIFVYMDEEGAKSDLAVVLMNKEAKAP